MKRSFDDLLAELCEACATVSRDKLFLAQRLFEAHMTRQYAALASPITEYFFEKLGDTVFLQNILNALARSERLRFVGSLRLVCMQWHSLVVLIDHLNFGPADFCGTLYPIALSRFTRVTSIHAHRRILIHFNRAVKEFGGVRKLVITPLAQDEISKYSYDVSPWTSLTALDFRDCDAAVKGLTQLTALQKLKISHMSMRAEAEELYRLTGLQTLRIRDFPEEFDPLMLPALRHLKSDCARHFYRYTGEGCWECDDTPLSDDEQEARDAYHPHCWNVRFTGHWVKGVFSGIAAYQYGDECSSFYGSFVDGKRDGPGEETCEIEQLQYRGSWRCGLRHGRFEVYSWTGFYPRVHTLECVELWERGAYLGEEECLVL